MSDQLKSRLKSFAWRTGMMVLAVSVDFLVQNLTEFNLTPQFTVVIGLVLGEISKYLNSRPEVRR